MGRVLALCAPRPIIVFSGPANIVRNDFLTERRRPVETRNIVARSRRLSRFGSAQNIRLRGGGNDSPMEDSHVNAAPKDAANALRVLEVPKNRCHP